jgi:superfamily II DNA helicase RecQ
MAVLVGSISVLTRRARTAELDIVVATVAFGMGIDKSNVRHVIHYGAPKTLETYYQQTGRAGRDGLASSCVLFWSQSDFAVAGTFAAEMQSATARERVQTGIDCMRRYCATASCRRRALLAYFGARSLSRRPPRRAARPAVEVCLTSQPARWARRPPPIRPQPSTCTCSGNASHLDSVAVRGRGLC